MGAVIDPWAGAIHVVVDLETLGRGPRAKLVSLGAVRFRLDEHGRVLDLDDFYRLIASGGANAARQEDAETVQWWAAQPFCARSALSIGPRYDLETALTEFVDWAAPAPDADAASRLMAWGYGDEFDLAILQDACDCVCRAVDDPDAPALGLALPWSFRRQANLRTLAQCFPHVPRPAHVGIKHNALHDARHEAHFLAALLRERMTWLQVCMLACADAPQDPPPVSYRQLQGIPAAALQ